MSGAKILEFGTIPDFGNLGFPDLEKNLEQRLEAIKTLPDLEKLIKLINPLIRAERYSADEQTILKRLRQRAYDRKRNPKFLISKPDQNLDKPIFIHSNQFPNLELQFPNSPVQRCLTNPTTEYETVCKEKHMETAKALSNQKNERFIDGANRALSNIDGEHFVKTAPKTFMWFSAAGLVSYFLWQQSLSLYETAGFTNSLYSAAGGILMIIGFAAYHSITRSWLALFFCLYAGAYEGYLMISGTIHDDNQARFIAVQNNTELIFLQEKTDKERTTYHDLKQRYDNPESKVFKNEWFLKNHLSPAWGAMVKANEELIAKKSALISTHGATHVTWLKIFYRLGLVFLCMMMVHRFFASCVWSKGQQ